MMSEASLTAGVWVPSQKQQMGRTIMHMSKLDMLLVLLQCYFVLMNLTVERFYCHSPLTRDDTRFLVKETVEFCEVNNPLFLQREEWMRMATCASAYCFCPGCVLYWTRWVKWNEEPGSPNVLFQVSAHSHCGDLPVLGTASCANLSIHWRQTLCNRHV
jgi:hypothetical protein